MPTGARTDPAKRPAREPKCSKAQTRAIEAASFPFEHLSEIAEIESWRKEVNRPIYHLHKWWAQRLGSVFRAILIGAFSPEGTDVFETFYSPARFPERVVFDPFMGSGTTVGEALKLGLRAIGRDINPVAELTVRSALRRYSTEDVVAEFKAVEKDIASRLRTFYQAKHLDGELTDVLYYFWVKFLTCPQCNSPVDLFSSYIFSQHAYPAKYPISRAVCPSCGEINEVHYDAEEAACRGCKALFGPRRGSARGQKAECSQCKAVFPIAQTAKLRGKPPEHRLYAKMILLPNGEKQYVRAEPFDLELYARATAELAAQQRETVPDVLIEPGYNTNQVLNYGYSSWRQMFNDRQLLCISLLFDRLRLIENPGVRQLLEVHLSGVLEFNNMFASFKGEGTGAVRHMFAHHILKPERTPLEANLWGTPKSSGSFSTLFQSRVLRALEYRENPFEQRAVSRDEKTVGEKVFGLSEAMGYEPASSFGEFGADKLLYLSCGDSSATDIAPESVDAIVTDPPFFDNVHYSQLADFFYVWLRKAGHDIANGRETTRSEKEVQHTDGATFAERLAAVWRECHRVLKADGLLIFSYHHSRSEGWDCVLSSLIRAGFYVSAVQPIKAEMSVAAPKAQASEPIDLDVIVVCRKRTARTLPPVLFPLLLKDATAEAESQVRRFNIAGRSLGKNDVRVVLMSQLLKRLSSQSEQSAKGLLHEASCEREIDRIYASQSLTSPD